MFKSRNTKSANSPGSGNGTKKPIVELRECVTRMNSIVKTICASYYLGSGGGSKKGGKSGSPLKRSPSKSGASAAKINGSNGTKFGGRSNNINSQFIPFNPKQEEELIELLRRIAELVAQGEQRAAADADDASTSNSISPDVTESSNSGNAIFEYFCEANVLGTIVNIVTGAAFTTDDTNDEKTSKNDDDDDNTNDSGNDSENDNASNEKKPRHVLLPPIDLATQAIQSVSILMQNVARVTSLYFILSNNKVNDLINLPLDYYTLAEQHRNGGDVNSIINRQKAKKSRSAEMSELTTHFISFLKSLAMRMNPETLQFYLTYSLENKNDVNFNTIQFPLYARALEFCCADEDTFVRATAMNLCLNTLRLATTGEPLSTGGSRTLQESLGDERLNENDGNTDRPDKKLSPDGSSLHLNKALPFRERLAISHYVCMPAHVQALTSATFTKIGQLCGSLEERIRNMDRIDWTLKSSTAENENGNKQKELQIDRIQQVKQFHDLAADFQDEILLLADVLEVGLVPLNEQIIEMMFAGVVYPLVLQPLQLYTSPENANNKTKAKTNQVADVSLAKAAFFVIGYIYHFISHKPFLHLLLTALLHPLAPEASKSLIQTSAPAIVQIYENGDIQIKTDNQQNGTSLDCYRFGRKSEDLDQNQMSGTKLLSECTYVLSPALAQLYQAEMAPQTFKPNSYRRSILACLSGTDGMAVLQPLAIYAIDAALATIKPEILKNIIFGANIRPEWEINFSRSDDITDTSNSNKNATENYMVEVIASMCRSITTTSISPNGLKSLSYNLVASHAICCTSLIDKPAKATALKLVEHRRRESASFMSQTPSRLTKHLKKIRKDQHSSKSSIDEDLKMDRIFFDPFCDGDKFAVENIVRRQDGNFWEGPAFISVAKDGGMHDLGKLICRDPSAIESAQTDEALYRCAANSAVAHLQVDAFAKLLRDDFDTAALKKQKGYLGVSAFALFNKNCIEGKKSTDRVLLSPLPPPFSSLLFDEETSSSATGSDIPQTGTVVQLVGKTAFPCVCEVTKESNPLFTDGEASVLADGIRWQSLWMVLMGKYMILAEPVKKDSGGNGRVITSCPLCCITVEKDDSADILQSQSPARRLLLTHFSPDTKSPGLFVIDTSDRDQLVNNDDVQITRSAMDLWFEDSNAAAKALKALNSKIVKARSRRGHKIREALAQDDRLRFQSVFSG